MLRKLILFVVNSAKCCKSAFISKRHIDKEKAKIEELRQKYSPADDEDINHERKIQTNLELYENLVALPKAYKLNGKKSQLTSSYLEIAAILRDLEILKSISYNNLNREIFVFFAQQYY